MERLTEQPSRYNHLEKMSVDELIANINKEDQTVALAIQRELPSISQLINAVEGQLRSGGRMFYMGCGSGGRLSVLDKIELPNTYGIEKGIINVILAGGEENLVLALEAKEDDLEDAWNQMQAFNVNEKDFVIGISASGTTPFVLSGLKKCRENHIPCGCIVSNPGSPISAEADYPVEVITGPEFVTGSTRMKCGTAQKMLFDMISTTVLIRLGRVEGNKMVNVRLINDKVVDRSVKMIMELSGLADYDRTKEVLLKCGNVKKSVEWIMVNEVHHQK
ncbi:MAG: N-acetylmuramic acid 6-phosphate etherase [Candidatus Ordinivivax streblomastigis]|uniref:N-acetylmuramic acid 6-phosphate etherase n=1 Tax=Candidatus Ordinivivax streblomastigis TaxID=2540710 RepID=A0A5M8NTN7_9BACT|nr:MAG: N-acetylmuramic acid 6-phosphate etherase [Candidatus Ordinivivax streblomastigis]